MAANLPTGLLPWIWAGLGVRLLLAPVASHPFDMSAWMSHQARFFNAGVNPLLNWKFSVILMAVLLASFFPAAVTSWALGGSLVLTQHFWIKLPFILADVGIALALAWWLWQRTEDAALARLGAILWLFNPAAIFYSSIHGQFDSLPSLLIVAAVALAQAGRLAQAYTGVILSGVAKYFGFVLAPLIFLWRRPSHSLHHLLRVGAAGAVAVLLAYPTIFGPESWLVGPLFNSVAGENAAPGSYWNVFAIPALSEFRASLLWVLPVAGCMAIVSFGLWKVARKEGSDSIPLLAGFAAVLGFLVAMYPLANPQFVVWTTPLLLGLALARGSLGLLVVAIVASFANLVSLVASEGSFAWFLNAVPAGQPADFVDFAGGRNVDLASSLGALYAVLTVTAAIVAIRAIFVERLRRLSKDMVSGLRFALLPVHIVVTVAFVLTAYQPALLRSYADAPNYAVDIDRVNVFPADRVRWLSKARGTVLAEWRPGIASFLSPARERLQIQIARPDPQPISGGLPGDSGFVDLPLPPVADSLDALVISVPASVASKTPPIVSITLDVRSDPLWRSRWWFPGGVLVLAGLLVGGYVFLVSRLSRWAWSRTNDEEGA